MKVFQNNKIFFTPVLLLAVFLFSCSISNAFTNPTQNPVGGTGSIFIEASTPANTFYLKSNGNVGIGNTNPTQKFTVFGTTTIGGTPAGVANGVFGITNGASTLAMDPNEISATAELYIETGTVMGFRPGGLATNSMYINSLGNVGIGTDAPTVKLEVNGTIKATAFEGPLSGTISAANVSSGSFGANTGGGNYTFPANLTVTGTYNGYQPSRSSTSVNSVYSMDSRSTNYLPQDRNSGLYVDFKGNTTDGLADGGTYHGVLTFRSYGGTTDFSGGPAMQLGYTENGNMFTRLSSGAAVWASWRKLLIENSSGNVGIGTVSPNSKLTIGTDFASVAGITVDTGGTSDSAFVARRATAKTAFGILPWDSQVYLSAGTYYDAGVWVQNNDTTDNLLFGLDPGAGARWYASNDGTSSWNVASNKQLWDAAGTWTSGVSGAVTGTVSAANVSSGNFGANTGGGNYTFPANVGIGTGSPNAKVDILQSGTINTTTPGTGRYGIHLTPADTVVDKTVGITFGAGDTSSGTTAQAGIYSQYSGAYGTKLYFATTNSYAVGSKTAMMIDSGGNVGIGNIAPGQKLDVTGNIRSSGAIISTYSDAFRMVQGSYGSFFRNDGSDTYLLLTNASDQYGSWNSLRPFRVNNASGKLYVGTTTSLKNVTQGAGTNERFYPNVASAAYDGTVAGAWIINTPIPRNSNQMVRIRVHGYAYGTADSVDFTIVGYPYSGSTGNIDGLGGAITSYDLQDNGTDSWNKYVGVNSSGNVAIAFGDTSNSAYFYRLSVDAWVTRTSGEYDSGWSISQSTVANFGFLDIRGPLTSSNNTCALVAYSGGATSCPAGYYTWSGSASASGYMLCCRVRNPI